MSINKDQVAASVRGFSEGLGGGSFLALVTGLAVMASPNFDPASSFAQSSFLLGICGLFCSLPIDCVATYIGKMDENSHHKYRGAAAMLGFLVPLIIMAASSDAYTVKENPPAVLAPAKPPIPAKP